MLEEAGFELMLVNARQVKLLPGRKSDVGDAAWLAELLEHGLLGAASYRHQPSGSCGTDPLPQAADPAPWGRGSAYPEDLGGRRHQAGLGRHRHPGRLRSRDAQRAGRWRARPQVLAELAKGRLRANLPSCARPAGPVRRASCGPDPPGLGPSGAAGGLDRRARRARHQGQGAGASRFPPALIFGHGLLAATGLVLWILYFTTDTDSLRWVAFAILLVVATLGFTMARVWRQERAAAEAATGRPSTALPPEQHFPVPLIGLHGLLAVTTLVLVLLSALGIGD